MKALKEKKQGSQAEEPYERAEEVSRKAASKEVRKGTSSPSREKNWEVNLSAKKPVGKEVERRKGGDRSAALIHLKQQKKSI